MKLQIGQTVRFYLRETSPQEWCLGDNEMHAALADLDLQIARVTSEACEGYYNLEFADGTELGAVSEFHLLPANT